MMRVRLLRDHAIDGKWELGGAVLTVADDMGRALLHQGYAILDDTVAYRKAVKPGHATARRQR